MRYILIGFFILISLVSKSQDIIIKRDGSEIPCKVEKISSVEIEYRRADQSVSGPIYTVAKSEVFMVRYKDGTKDVFNAISEVNSQRNYVQPASVTPPAPPPVTTQPLNPTENTAYQSPSAGASSYQSVKNKVVDRSDWFWHQAYIGYGGSYLSPFGGNTFYYLPSGLGFYWNWRMQFPIDYHAYTISDGSGGVYILDAYGSSLLSMESYELDTDWKLFYRRNTMVLGMSKLLGTDLGRLIFPGIYGGIGFTKQTKYYPYWSNNYGDYIVVKDTENSTLGAELEIGASFVIEFLHVNTGFSLNTSTAQIDWLFGLGFEY